PRLVLARGVLHPGAAVMEHTRPIAARPLWPPLPALPALPPQCRRRPRLCTEMCGPLPHAPDGPYAAGARPPAAQYVLSLQLHGTDPGALEEARKTGYPSGATMQLGTFQGGVGRNQIQVPHWD